MWIKIRFSPLIKLIVIIIRMRCLARHTCDAYVDIYNEYDNYNDLTVD
jgi:hypothetical protein